MRGLADRRRRVRSRTAPQRRPAAARPARQGPAAGRLALPADDGRGSGGGHVVRDAAQPQVEHAGHGSGRVPVEGLCPRGPAAGGRVRIRPSRPLRTGWRVLARGAHSPRASRPCHPPQEAGAIGWGPHESAWGAHASRPVRRSTQLGSERCSKLPDPRQRPGLSFLIRPDPQVVDPTRRGLDENAVALFVEHLRVCRCNEHKRCRFGRVRRRACLSVQHVRQIGSVVPAADPLTRSVPPILASYRTWMERSRSVIGTTPDLYERRVLASLAVVGKAPKATKLRGFGPSSAIIPAGWGGATRRWWRRQ